jgi:hypothetical protein
MNICKIDNNRVFTGEVQTLNSKLAIPIGWIAIDPPKEGIQQFNSDKWIKLETYPIAEVIPMVESSKVISKVDFVETLIKAGFADTLDKMLAASSAEIRQAWYAYTTINITDERLVAFFNAAGLDLKEIFK